MSTNSYVSQIIVLTDAIITDCTPFTSGGHSSIYTGKVNMKGSMTQNVIVKYLTNDFDAEGENEVRFAREQFRHPHITEIIAAETTPIGTYICMPIYARSMADVIYSTDPINDRLRLMSELIAALSHLHNNSFVHRDIKPENIMLTSQRKVVLIDFSLSGLIQPGEVEEFAPHAEWYRGPEYYFHEQNDPMKADLWALGMTLIEFDTRKPILSHASNRAYCTYLSKLVYPVPLNDTSGRDHFIYQRLVNGNGTLPFKGMNNLLCINPKLRTC
ncbi:putative protein kinase [Emiliania huxleyi virus 86]|uniref:Protein kinase domain-containing protein n=1 Tax=Emiliania huxleyi virus 86 (isolate United Kingdom/English Channel/1999) TaxID=654925 RepID=Q4A228_EHV8U|nr:putative protein kinase [Emiliania huxleyi virus 86]AEO97991.1 hypothetical protein ENVG_00095 [Emiliania huxleyi virus 84]AHA55076.1 putative protein kinase [Emiliania huxleyi virus 145]AHA56080.1 putative protein kinase [Emiliania huxleyi virus 164]UKZ11479.1 hypothetical protein EhVM1_000464 [Emiliania huxleyi virus M1]CAZ69781.1 putative protein kinase [Emiliania huxleyi virus 99B1]|mmetsp:Transcript_22810/g.65121  ORF Transcript_22810/g.65121 Transcript_22810/m.65121 type:complete len:272 (-) Transcript_22810:119-934(-)